jgi:hypothetical protein
MFHNTNLIGPGFSTVVRPNNDTLYSAAWLDLRAEPAVLTVPEIRDRYYSFQLVDLYTFNFGYIGTRTTGKGAGRYMVAGPQWKGATPAGINEVFRSEGYFVYALVRTELKGDTDLPNVLAIQHQYGVQTLSAYLGRRALTPRPGPPHEDFPAYNSDIAASADFIWYFNFLLGYLDIYRTEEKVIASFRDLGIGPNRPFNAAWLHPNVRSAIEADIASATNKIHYQGDHMGEEGNGWNLTPRVFGNRQAMEEEYPEDLYLVRAAAAYKGLYGCDLEEAYYPSTGGISGWLARAVGRHPVLCAALLAEPTSAGRCVLVHHHLQRTSIHGDQLHQPLFDRRSDNRTATGARWVIGNLYPERRASRGQNLVLLRQVCVTAFHPGR